MDDQLKKFVEQVRTRQGIDFPLIANKMGLSWVRDIQPQLRTNPEFLAAMQEVLQELKYSLLQSLFTVARDGKSRGGSSGEPTHIREIIKHIDAGTLLGAGMVPDEPGEKAEDPALARERLKRMGYSEKEVDELLKES